MRNATLCDAQSNAADRLHACATVRLDGAIRAASTNNRPASQDGSNANNFPFERPRKQEVRKTPRKPPKHARLR